eukprot:Nk52_evm77s1810 gene=Nk52_evmTU77s1810
MATFTLYHNPQCSKSRAAKQILDERNVKYSVVEYLNTPLSYNTLEKLYSGMDSVEIEEMVRSGEPDYKEVINGKDGDEKKELLLKFLEENPKLLQRPILESSSGKTVIGRPTENIAALVDTEN